MTSSRDIYEVRVYLAKAPDSEEGRRDHVSRVLRAIADSLDTKPDALEYRVHAQTENDDIVGVGSTEGRLLRGLLTARI